MRVDNYRRAPLLCLLKRARQVSQRVIDHTNHAIEGVELFWIRGVLSDVARRRLHRRMGRVQRVVDEEGWLLSERQRSASRTNDRFSSACELDLGEGAVVAVGRFGAIEEIDHLLALDELAEPRGEVVLRAGQKPEGLVEPPAYRQVLALVVA